MARYYFPVVIAGSVVDLQIDNSFDVVNNLDATALYYGTLKLLFDHVNIFFQKIKMRIPS